MSDKAQKARFTQSLTLHLNGGSKFSELHYDVFFNGTKTNITRHTRTNGRPEYIKTHDELHFGDETFDMLKDGDPMPWLLERAKKVNP